MKTALFRRMGMPAVILASALAGSALTGIALADYPHMNSALTALYTAHNELQAAAADKGGHRSKAISYVNDAIAEVKAGIAYAQNNK